MKTIVSILALCLVASPALARGNATAAQPWAAKAHALLKDDEGLRANDAARLARLASVADVAAGAPTVTTKGAW